LGSLGILLTQSHQNAYHIIAEASAYTTTPVVTNDFAGDLAEYVGSNNASAIYKNTSSSDIAGSACACLHSRGMQSAVLCSSLDNALYMSLMIMLLLW
jgi:hypothetical protein